MFFLDFFLVGINLFRGDIIVCFGNRTFIGNIVSWYHFLGNITFWEYFFVFLNIYFSFGWNCFVFFAGRMYFLRGWICFLWKYIFFRIIQHLFGEYGFVWWYIFDGICCSVFSWIWLFPIKNNHDILVLDFFPLDSAGNSETNILCFWTVFPGFCQFGLIVPEILEL